MCKDDFATTVKRIVLQVPARCSSRPVASGGWRFAIRLEGCGHWHPHLSVVVATRPEEPSLGFPGVSHMTGQRRGRLVVATD